jgi:hypothetical protein
MNAISDEKVLHKVIEILRGQARWLDEDEPITPESKIQEELDIGLCEEIWIIKKLNIAFDITMPVEFLKPGVTVSELTNIVEERIAEVAEIRSIKPDEAEYSKRNIDWLTKSFDPESSSSLSQWPERYENAALAKYAALKKTYPAYLDKATKYLFDAAAIGYEQIETAISKSALEARSIDRRASMVGGFPWTDADNPWPKYDLPDGHTIWGEPVFQLNLATLSEQLGIALPPSLLQFWDYFDLREISLASTMTGSDGQPVEPSWFIPERSAEPPVGWDHSGQEGVGQYIKVGDPTFQLPKMETFLDGAAYWDEYVFQDAQDWKDSSEWMAARPVPAEIAEKLQEDEEAVANAFQDQKSSYPSFLGIPMDSRISYEDWVKDGYKALYSAGGSGLYIWGGGFIKVFYRNKEGKFEFTARVGS